MIAVDTNILVYAHRKDSAFHGRADDALTGLCEGRSDWAIPWPCIHEFIAIVTHPGIYRPATPLADALTQVECWLESPRLRLLGEEVADLYWPRLKGLLSTGRVAGPLVHDARVAAICLAHGIDCLWTTDRDFSRFPELPTINPLA
jgi:toxin-antitoxin system PIN domain toxin